MNKFYNISFIIINYMFCIFTCWMNRNRKNISFRSKYRKWRIRIIHWHFHTMMIINILFIRPEYSSH